MNSQLQQPLQVWPPIVAPGQKLDGLWVEGQALELDFSLTHPIYLLGHYL